MSAAATGSGSGIDSSGGAWQFLDAAAEGTTNNAIAALRHTLPRGLRPPARKQIRSKISTARSFNSFSEKTEVETPQDLGLLRTSMQPTDVASSFIFGGETPARLEKVKTASNISVVTKAADSTMALQADKDRWLGTSSERSRISDFQTETGDYKDEEVNHLAADNEQIASTQTGWKANWLQSSASSDAESISEAFPAGAGRSSSGLGQEARQHQPDGSAAHQLGSKPSHAHPALKMKIQLKSHSLQDNGGESLDAARLSVSRCNFAEAIRACVSTLQGPPAAIDLLDQICTSWEQSVLEASQVLDEKNEKLLFAEVQRREEAEQHVLKQGDELCCLNAEIRALRDRVTEWRRLKEERDRELAAERQKRHAAELQAVAFQQHRLCYEDTLREATMLRQQLTDALQVAAASASTGEVARRVAEHECNPLLACHPEERTVVKKRLLVKWHPDKQPSPGHALLATQVFQEFRNRPEWDL